MKKLAAAAATAAMIVLVFMAWLLARYPTQALVVVGWLVAAAGITFVWALLYDCAKQVIKRLGETRDRHTKG